MLKKICLTIICIWIGISVYINFNILYLSSEGASQTRIFNIKNTSSSPVLLNTQTIFGNKRIEIAKGEIGSTELKWGQGFSKQNSDFNLYKSEKLILSYDNILRNIAVPRGTNYKFSDEVSISGHSSVNTDYQFFPFFIIKEGLIMNYEITVR